VNSPIQVHEVTATKKTYKDARYDKKKEKTPEGPFLQILGALSLFPALFRHSTSVIRLAKLASSATPLGLRSDYRLRYSNGFPSF
tara:strand:- start:495 stop:749 length:255 start_codon:yes stop_codon:yes gene_type:complete